MFSRLQCQAARLMTGTDTPDEQISQEYAAMLGSNRSVAAMRLDKAVQATGLPLNESWDQVSREFGEIADQYGVSPATILCLYIENATAQS